MRNSVFYKDKYIIALYDNEDRHCGTFLNTIEMQKELKIKDRNLANRLSECFYGKRKTFRGLSVFFIDIYEQHNDEFAEEDELFLNRYDYKRADIVSKLLYYESQVKLDSRCKNIEMLM